MKTETPIQTTQLTPAFKAGLANEPSLKPLLARYRAAAVPSSDETYDPEEIVATGKRLCDHALNRVLELGVQAQGARVVEICERGAETLPSRREQLDAATEFLFQADRSEPTSVAALVTALFLN